MQLTEKQVEEILSKRPESRYKYFIRTVVQEEEVWGLMDEEGWLTYAGRADDMLKVGGIYVSPIEVEEALASHPDVLEAAVIGAEDADALVKPHAYVVVHNGVVPDDALADRLKAHVKDHLAPFKYPRWITFVDELPKTATGKIQRFQLRND